MRSECRLGFFAVPVAFAAVAGGAVLPEELGAGRNRCRLLIKWILPDPLLFRHLGLPCSVTSGSGKQKRSREKQAKRHQRIIFFGTSLLPPQRGKELIEFIGHANAH